MLSCSLARRALPTLLFGLTLGAGATLAGDTPEFVYIQLGTLGGAESVGYGLNASHQVVGWSTIAGCTAPSSGAPCRRAYVWQDGVMTDLGVLPGDEDSFARAINDAGFIVGSSESNITPGTGDYHGVTWTGGVISPLPDLGNGESFVHDVNEAGVVAGWAFDPTVNKDRAVTWSDGSIRNIGKAESHESNRAQGINDAGDVVGFAFNLFQPNDSILYSGSSWSTIGGTGGQFQNSEASDLNNTGTAVGLQAFPSGSWHAALWNLGVGVTDAGTLPGMAYGELYGVNDAGLAVGRSYNDLPPESRAVYWDGDTLHDLNDLLPAGVNALLFEAQAINESGDIVGTAVVGGKFRAFLMLADPVKGSWDDLGQALAGTPGLPSLQGSGALIGGASVGLALNNAQPGATARLIAGFSEQNAPFKAGVMVPALDFVFPPQTVSGLGELNLTTAWPFGVPSGFELSMQYWVQDAGAPVGWAASNGLRATAP